MKQIYLSSLLAVFLSIVGAKVFAYNIEVANVDGVTICYKFINDGTELEVTTTYNRYTGSVVIPESVTYDGNTYPVTSIGYQAFFNCSGLTELTIPNSVTSIGYQAFFNCSDLTELTIPNSVTSIGYRAFYNCRGLTELTIPNSVTSIESYAFSECRGLKKVIVKDLAVWCNISFYNEESNPLYYAEHLYSDADTEITNLVIPDSATKISNYAFCGCSGLTSVIIPNSVTSIGSSAFQSCSGLTSVIIPNGVTSIGSNAFWNCGFLYKNAYPSNLSNPFSNGVSIAYPKECSIDENNVIYDAEKTKVYYAPTTLTNAYTIPNTVTSIGDNAFYGCDALTAVIIPEAVTSIGNYAFRNCSALSTLTFNATNCSSLGSSVFPSTISSLTFGEKVTNIPGNILYDGRIENLTIPNSVTEIGSSAFRNCSNLKSLTLGSGLISIGSSAFSSTTIAKVFWLGNTPPTNYRNVSASVNYVANDQYNFSNQVKYQFLSSKFTVNGTVYVPVSPSDRTCDVVDCIYDEGITAVEISDKVTNQGIELSVMNINQYAFYGNHYIQTLTLGEQIGSLGNSVFQNCSKLQSIVIPNAVQTMGSYAFSGCSSLASTKIGTGIQAINESTFSGCSSLSEIELPKSVEMINNYVFEGCSKLQKVVMADGTAELQLGSNGSSPMFADCPLNTVYIGRNISYNTSSSYGYSPFYRNTTLTTVTITDVETEIPDNEFYGCTSLKNVTIGNGVTTIGKWAFSGCRSLDYFEYGSAVETIGQEAFSDCTAMTKLLSHAATPPTCGSQALDDINKWTCTLSIPKGYTAAYQQADQWKEFFFINDDLAVPEGNTTEKKAEALAILEEAQKVYDAYMLYYDEKGDSMAYYQKVVSAQESNNTKASGILNDIAVLEKKISESGLTAEEKAAYQKTLADIKANVEAENKNLLADNKFAEAVKKHYEAVSAYQEKLAEYKKNIEEATTIEKLDEFIAAINKGAEEAKASYLEPVEKEYAGLKVVEEELAEISKKLNELGMAVRSYADIVNDAITGISGVNANSEVVIVYTISGKRQVMKKDDLKLLPKGLYIINGRKHVVK